MSSDRVTINLEVLRMAREMVNIEYLESKAQLHNQWLAESDLLWRTSRRRLVYPPFPPFPTEDVIVARAKVLLEFLSKVDSPAAPFPSITQVSSVEEPTNVEVTTIRVVDQVAEVLYNDTNTDKDFDEVEVVQNNIEPVVEPSNDVAPENTTANKRVPSLLRRLMGS